MLGVCFLFGNRDCGQEIIPLLDEAIESHYTMHGVRTFVVGHRGRFDQIATVALGRAKKRHSDMTVLQLVAYYPTEGAVEIPEGFDAAFYPMGMEKVPKHLAIVAANHKMVDMADSIVCAVRYVGNCWSLLDYARTREAKGKVIIDNIYGNEIK